MDVPQAPRPVRVLKFGGAALSEGGLVRRAALLARPGAGERHVLVVSAVGDVTRSLERAAREAVAGRPDGREVRLRHKRLLAELDLEPGLLHALHAELDGVLAGLAGAGRLGAAERDHALSIGERAAARLVAAALRAAGIEATPVDAWDLGLVSDSNHGRARPRAGVLAAVGRALAAVPGVPVVTGFLAADGQGRLTTLGRNGSDLSAALLAEAVGAVEVQFWKRSGAVHSADPRLVPDARVLRELGYAQAALFAHHGAEVLHPDTLTPLARAGIPARVLALESPQDPGTRIAADAQSRGALGIAARRGLARVRLALEPLEERGAAGARLGAALASLALEPVHLCGAPGELALVAPDGEDLARLAAGFRLAQDIERPLATLALVADSARGADLVLLRESLEAALVEPLALWSAADGRAAVALVAEEDLPAAARSLHTRVYGAGG
jgi:aspartate kinase